MEQDREDRVYVWDPFVRVFHWALVAAFAIAFVTEDEVLVLHVWAGYAVGGLVTLRVLWGFVGPKHARFGDFLYSPRVVIAYVGRLLTFGAKRYIGHSPGGGAMVIVLLISLAITVASGLVVYAAEEDAGPLAAVFGAAAIEAPGIAGPAEASERGERDEEDDHDENNSESAFGEAMEELHEFFANLTLTLVIVHIGAVLLASLAHRENLTKAMITGYKRR